MTQSFTTTTRAIFSTQVSDIDILGKSDVRRVLVECVSSPQPVELEGEIDSATNGRSAEHCLENVSLTINITDYSFLLI